MITNVAYTSIGTTVAITNDDGAIWHDDATRPADTALRVELAAFLAAGGVIAPYVAPAEAVPGALSKFQARTILRRVGLFDAVAAAIAASGNAELQDAWAYADEFRRASPFIAEIAALLVPPLTDPQIDDLYRAGSQITV